KITPNNEGTYEASTKIQFLEISYDQKQQKFTRKFIIQVSYFLPRNFEEPILIKTSAPFSVCARKRNVAQNKRKKIVFVEDPLSKKTKNTKRQSQEVRMPTPASIMSTM